MDLQELFDLHNKTVVITGGAGYLGSAMSEVLVAYGAKLYIMGRDHKKNKEFADKLREEYDLGKCESVTFDIDNKDSIEAAINKIIKKEECIDVLINNAAYSCSRPLHEYTDDEWERGINGTINGVYRVTKCVLPYMMGAKKGNIINIASMYGMVAPDMSIYGNSGQNNPANYGAGKAAIIQLTKYIASVYARYGIRANAISPGPFPNENVQKNKDFINNLCSKNPMNRIGVPRDLQGIILYLASDASSYTNGQNIAVDGGWTAW